jgi:signal-transduction protein with cAMP-binding, CBS, and nucleotidyltransferase domain
MIQKGCVRSVMTRGPTYVEPRATLRSVARTLQAELIGAALVRWTDHMGAVVAAGIISERDIARALAEGADPDNEMAMDFMTDDMASVTPDDPIEDAVRMMLDFEIRHMPVIEHGVAVGILSIRDLLRAELEASLA